VERKLGGGANFVLIQPTGDGTIKYRWEKLRNEMLSGTLEANTMEAIPEIDSATYVLVETTARRGTYKTASG